MIALTQEYVKTRLRYDPETGVFTRKTSGPGGSLGDVAGWIDNSGYRIITIGGGRCRAHRLAWLYVHGVLPSMELDHKNGDPSDNRIVNLREATSTENRRNQRKRSNNTSGVKGVHWHRANRKWVAQIRLMGKKIHLGIFTSIEAAAAAYRSRAQEEFGEFFRAETQ